MPADDARPVPPVLIVGHGLIGAAVRAVLLAQGVPAVCIGRRLAADPGYRAYDLASEAGRAALHAAVTELGPGCVLLTHGPSDVTWIDENEAVAAAVHCGVAEIVARAGVPVVLVSTDNVFSGTRGRYDADDPAEPANGYGRVKALAESMLLASGPVLVLRVSLIYGWAGPGLRATFAQRCLDAAVEGRLLSAPTDQLFTPIHVSDVATVLAAVCRAGWGSSASSIWPAPRNSAGTSSPGWPTVWPELTRSWSGPACVGTPSGRAARSSLRWPAEHSPTCLGWRRGDR